MLLSALQLPPGTEVTGPLDVDVTGAGLDSREVGPGDLYAALPGAHVHGASFAADVLARGVRAILTDPAGRTLVENAAHVGRAPTLLVHPEPRAVLGWIAAAIHGTDPAHPRLLGVTGTNGKTTTTYLLDALMRALGHRTGLIGTVATVIDGDEVPSVRTTPEAPALHSLFARMRAASVDTCLMEVSSHALSQHRVDGARFAVAGFTNLTQDHLDYHGTMEEYFAAKAKLFTPEFAESGVVVLADSWARELARIATIPVVTLAEAHTADASDADYTVDISGDADFVLTGPGGLRIVGRSPLPGGYNVMNTCLALVMALRAGEDPARVAGAAASFTVTVPGRMEVVSPAAPRAIVDYSHSPDALAHVLGSITADPLVVVFGAGGDRDHSKRATMGAAAAAGADVVIVTDDNPRSEDPALIRAAVESGITRALAEGTARVSPANVRTIASRAEAIAAGVAAAGENGTLVVAGKGHETGQEIQGVKHHFDDREQTREAVARYRVHTGNGKV